MRTSVISSSKFEHVKNVNFSISVGTRVPKTVHFYTVTPEIVTIYPRYRGYKFFVVNDEIIIVDPTLMKSWKSSTFNASTTKGPQAFRYWRVGQIDEARIQRQHTTKDAPLGMETSGARAVSKLPAGGADIPNAAWRSGSLT